MLSFLLSLVFTLGAVPDKPIPLPQIVSAAPMPGGVDVCLVFADGSCGIAGIAEMLAARAWVDVPVTMLSLAGPPTEYTLIYRSAIGAVTVRTPCANYASIDECARGFLRAVEASQRVIPRIPD